MIDMRPVGRRRIRLVFYAPTRGLIGLPGRAADRQPRHRHHEPAVHEYAPYKGVLQGRRNGVLISTDVGEAVATRCEPEAAAR